MRLLSKMCDDSAWIRNCIVSATGERRRLVKSTLGNDAFFAQIMRVLTTEKRRTVLLALGQGEYGEI